MSFVNNIKEEILELQIKKNCCKKAFLLGLLINCRRSDSNYIETEYMLEFVADKVLELLRLLYSVKAEKSIVIKPGKKYYRISFSSKSISNVFDELCEDPENTIHDVVSFNCSGCEQAFFRGVFVACAKLTDPQKGYQLELSLSSENVSLASKLYRFMSLLGFVPKIVNRKNSVGLYFKSNSVISDILYSVGAVGSSFEYSNVVIEKEIRNNENRATNCVAKNIYKSVSASQKQIDAIEKLIASHRINSLPEELRQTAQIRLDNPDASLTELSMLHTPPISKSGLNHRLKKLCGEAEFI